MENKPILYEVGKGDYNWTQVMTTERYLKIVRQEKKRNPALETVFVDARTLNRIC